jgi:hypothetical protein
MPVTSKPQSTGGYGVRLLVSFRVIACYQGVVVWPLTVPAVCPWFLVGAGLVGRDGGAGAV